MSVSINSYESLAIRNTAVCAEIAYLNEVDLGEALVVPRLLYVKDGNDIFMVEISQ
jgi:hypothetical protein